MKLFGSTEKLKYKTKHGKNVVSGSLEVVEVALVQRNLVNNHYQRKCEVSYTFVQIGSTKLTVID